MNSDELDYDVEIVGKNAPQPLQQTAAIQNNWSAPPKVTTKLSRMEEMKDGFDQLKHFIIANKPLRGAII